MDGGESLDREVIMERAESVRSWLAGLSLPGRATSALNRELAGIIDNDPGGYINGQRPLAGLTVEDVIAELGRPGAGIVGQVRSVGEAAIKELRAALAAGAEAGHGRNGAQEPGAPQEGWQDYTGTPEGAGAEAAPAEVSVVKPRRRARPTTPAADTGAPAALAEVAPQVETAPAEAGAPAAPAKRRGRPARAGAPDAAVAIAPAPADTAEPEPAPAEVEAAPAPTEVAAAPAPAEVAPADAAEAEADAAEAVAEPADQPAPATPEAAPARRRGRPSRAEALAAAAAAAAEPAVASASAEATASEAAPKRRGRPRRDPSAAPAPASEAAPKRRGRPRRDQSAAPIATPAVADEAAAIQPIAPGDQTLEQIIRLWPSLHPHARRAVVLFTSTLLIEGPYGI